MVLRVEDGTELRGSGFGAAATVSGEVVFSTGMSGYVETLTDPSYRGQTLVLTYPLVGNHGVPAPRPPGSIDRPYESGRIQVQALVVQNLVRRTQPSRRRALAGRMAGGRRRARAHRHRHAHADAPAARARDDARLDLNCGLALHDSGAEPTELRRILARAADVSREHPMVVSKFETHAREVEIDAVANRGELVLWAISEHVEDAGVHCGDATLVLPPQTLNIATIRRVRQIATLLARELAITGPFTGQFLAKHNAVKVIECNLRASRSFPFVSKVTGENVAAESMRRMLGVGRPIVNRSLDLDLVGVKAPMFSFSRLTGADAMLGVEMLSAGEVGCLGRDLGKALLHALLATGMRLLRRGVLLSLGPVADRYWFADEAKVIAEQLKLRIYARSGTAEMLTWVGIACTVVGKGEADGLGPRELIDRGDVDLVINIPREYDQFGRPDGYLIRRCAADAGVPLITDLQLARALVEEMRSRAHQRLEVLAWDDVVHG